MMKLKTKKNFIKGLRTKIRNQKNKDRSWNLNKYKDNSKILNGQCEIQGYEREKRGGEHLWRQIILPSLPRVVPSRRRQSFNSNNKGIFGYQETTRAPPNTASTSHTMTHALQALTTFFNNVLYLLKYQITPQSTWL